VHPLDDTIAAIATAPGAAGLAVVRLSGPAAITVADAVFHGATPLAEAASHSLHHGWAMAGGERLDEVVAALFRAPRSYTREDVVEFSCHGGALPARRVLETLLAAGARPAGPGEFTLRAFLNGRIDLPQAEAVADLIASETEAARTLAVSQLAGGLSRRLAAIEERLADARAEVEARVDFAEDVGGVEVPAHVADAMAAAEAELASLLEGSRHARAVREGVRVAIAGRPNVGKSSLFNALLGEQRAIVSARPGTTRDRVSEPIEVAGVRVTLSDTAGLRDSGEPIEAIGIERAREALEGAAIVLWVVDTSEPLAAEDRDLAARLAGRRVLVALNKSDRPARVARAELGSLLDAAPRSRLVEVSATEGRGLDEVRAALASLLGAEGVAGAAGLAGAAANPRHVEALERARAAVRRAAAAASAGAAGEIVALEIRDALAALGEVTGRAVSEDLLERIFARFCVGK
jgi:tRNA modification GTPase